VSNKPDLFKPFAWIIALKLMAIGIAKSVQKNVNGFMCKGG